MKNCKLRLPGRLIAGDMIAVAAPASPFDPEKLMQGADVLRSMGFEVLTPSGLFEKKGYLAGNDHQRAEILNEIFESSQVKAIICARGGFGSIRILDKINYEAVRKNPKIFVGFSDITTLLNAFYCQCGLATFHGPTVTCLADSDRKTQMSLFSALTSAESISIVPDHPVAIKPGVAVGPVGGGNLTSLCHLIGTPFFPSFDRHILFFEDRGEALYKIDRMLAQMKLAGVFQKINGVALGDFSGCEGKEAVYQIFEDHFREYNIPIIAGLNAGHEKLNVTLPFGIRAELNADSKFLRFFQTGTCMDDSDC